MAARGGKDSSGVYLSDLLNRISNKFSLWTSFPTSSCTLVYSLELFRPGVSSVFYLLFFLGGSICVHHTQPVSNNLTSSLQSGSIRSAGFSPLSFSASVLAPFDSRYLTETGEETNVSSEEENKRSVTFQPLSAV